MFRALLLVFLVVLLTSCTSGRWIVVDESAIDQNESPSTINSRVLLEIDSYPSTENPTIAFTALQISEKEYSQRVKVERTIQKYRPKWGYLILTMMGAGFAFTVANTNLVNSTVSTSQKVSLNIAGGLLGILSMTNLAPTGEPIYTGEVDMLRKSGIEVISDTTMNYLPEEELLVDISVNYDSDEIFEQSGVGLTNNRLEINLGSFSADLADSVDRDSEIRINLSMPESSREFRIPVTDFLAPFVTIHEPISYIRTEPTVNDVNILAEVGDGSQLEMVEDSLENWYKIRYSSTDAYIEKSAGSVQWISTADSGPVLLVEFADVPFGDVDVENGIPVLKSGNPNDRALILTNARENQVGTRQYLSRDHQLFRTYMGTALQIEQEQIKTLNSKSRNDWQSQFSQLEPMDGEGSLIVFLSGFATITNEFGQYEISMLYENEDGEQILTPFEAILDEISRLNPGSLFLFTDMQFESTLTDIAAARNGSDLALQRAANQYLQSDPNSIIIFSNLPGQQSSLYTGAADENKRHHIFSYYWAEALKQRKTQMSALIQHLNNNVDYTSRRLHDRPQEIRAFGNFMLNIANP